MPLVEKRYAEALIEVSKLTGLLDVFERELLLSVKTIENNDELKVLLNAPHIGTEVKKEVLTNVIKNAVGYEISNFLLLVLDKGRIKFLPGIFNEYRKLADRERKVLELTVVSAAPLEPEQLDRIKEEYRKKHNAVSVKGSADVDISLVGGVKVVSGDRVTDGTIKGRLEGLREFLLEE